MAKEVRFVDSWEARRFKVMVQATDPQDAKEHLICGEAAFPAEMEPHDDILQAVRFAKAAAIGEHFEVGEVCPAVVLGGEVIIRVVPGMPPWLGAAGTYASLPLVIGFGE